MREKYIFLGINGLILTLACIIVYAYVTTQKGAYIYPLDDAYIHLAIAKNIALFDNYGVTKYAFSSTSSSPLFTIANAVLIKYVGNSTLYPLLINLLVAFLFLMLVHIKLKELDDKFYAIVISLIIWFPLIYVQILTGMEHTIHIVFVLLILIALEKYLGKNRHVYFYILCIVSACSTMIRYESLFLIFGICVLLFLRKQYLNSVLLGLFSLSLVTAFGVYSVQMGADFFPNSLLVKGNTNIGDPVAFLQETGRKFLSAKYLLPLIAGNVYSIYSTSPNRFSISKIAKTNPIQIITLVTLILHTSLASFGWLFRYDAYLKLLGVISLIPLIHLVFERRPTVSVRYIIPILVFSLFSLVCLKDIAKSFTKMRFASINIYEQQIQVARFVETYYYHSKIAANDIGAIAYYSQIHLLDLVGLGNDRIQQMRRAIRKRSAEDTFIDKVESILNDEQFEIAILYDLWFSEVPDNFIKVAEWKISNNVIAGSDVVSFYAIGDENVAKLATSLVDFNVSIDQNVEVSMLPIHLDATDKGVYSRLLEQ